MSDILYLKLNRNSKVTNKDVTLSQVAKLECTDQSVVNRLKTLKILTIHESKKTAYVFSVLKIIELIHEIYPALEINNIGEMDFVVEYDGGKKTAGWMELVKAAFVCLTIFFGAAFTIMTFNNDVSVTDVFSQLYELVTGSKSDGFTILEIAYSLGLGLGIIIFYNHFGGRRMNTDPTPVQVEMRLYEQDVNTCLVENHEREGTSIDVD